MSAPIAQRQFRESLEGGWPRMWKNETMKQLPVEEYLKFGDENNDDGGLIAISLPTKDSSVPDMAIFDGSEEHQEHVHITLADFLALVSGRTSSSSSDVLLKRGMDAIRKARNGTDTDDMTMPYYGCQIALAGCGAPQVPSVLRHALASGARACLPAWAEEAITSADEAISASFSSSDTTAFNSSSSCINAWLCAGRGGADVQMMRTEAHYDGFHNMMCVLSGRKIVELWPPGESHMCRSSPAWVHHYTRDEQTGELPPAQETLVLDAGCVGFWPEGWWHRVTSLPDTRAVNIWWSGIRPSLVKGGRIPDLLVPFALRQLAHHATTLLIADRLHAIATRDRREYRKEKKKTISKSTKVVEISSSASASTTTQETPQCSRYPLLALPESANVEDNDSRMSPASKRAKMTNAGSIDSSSITSESDDTNEEDIELKMWVDLLRRACENNESMERALRSLRLASVTMKTLRKAATSEAARWLQVVESFDGATAYVTSDNWAAGLPSSASGGSFAHEVIFLPLSHINGLRGHAERAVRTFIEKKEHFARVALRDAVYTYTGLASCAT